MLDELEIRKQRGVVDHLVGVECLEVGSTYGDIRYGAMNGGVVLWECGP